jgi:pimeloyl-ACP methyl ester carboxylesterase
MLLAPMLGEALGAVAALQQEGLAGGDARQRLFQVARLTGKNQRRKRGKLRLDIGRRPDQFGDRRAAQDLPGFAGYLARRGCAVLTYDYRGTGDSRQKALTGYNQPKSLVGFKASMSDWAALDVTAAVAWMRERYKALPLNYVGHSFGGQALGLLPNNTEVSRALLIAAQAGYWKLMASPERYRVYAMLNFVGTPSPGCSATRRAGAGSARTCRRTCSCNGSAG